MTSWIELAARVVQTPADGLERLFPARSRVVRVIEADPAPPRRERLCLFAHYDPRGRVARYVLRHLEALAALGADIVFVSTAPELDREALAALAPLCRRIVLRENAGFDFGSWRIALAGIDLAPCRELILTNDSVFGPLFPLEDAFARMEADPALDLWGITDSWHPRHHLQSYFLVFRRRAFASAAFASFWAQVPLFRTKGAVVRNCELELTRRLRDTGFRVGALCPYGGLRPPAPVTTWDLRLRHLVETQPLNPTHFLWRTLVERHRCPFLKVELLRDNPVGVQDLHRLDEVLAACTDYDRSLIGEHLGSVAQDVGR